MNNDHNDHNDRETFRRIRGIAYELTIRHAMSPGEAFYKATDFDEYAEKMQKGYRRGLKECELRWAAEGKS